MRMFTAYRAWRAMQWVIQAATEWPPDESLIYEGEGIGFYWGGAKRNRHVSLHIRKDGWVWLHVYEHGEQNTFNRCPTRDDLGHALEWVYEL